MHREVRVRVGMSGDTAAERARLSVLQFDDKADLVAIEARLTQQDRTVPELGDALNLLILLR